MLYGRRIPAPKERGKPVAGHPFHKGPRPERPASVQREQAEKDAQRRRQQLAEAQKEFERQKRETALHWSYSPT